MNENNLLESVKCLIDFLDSRECGESYWVDDEGRHHNADIGYVNEFLEDLRLYLNGEWKDPHSVSLASQFFNYSVQYRMIGNGLFSEIFCKSVNHACYANGDPVLEVVNDILVTRIPLKKTAWLQIIELNTGKVIFTYDGPQ